MENLPSLTNIIAILVAIVILFILFRVFKMILTVLAIIIFLIAGFVTNPSKEEHLSAIHKKAEKHNVLIPDGMVEVDDFKIISFTKVGKKEDKEIVGIGGFTQVWIFGNLNSVDQQ